MYTSLFLSLPSSLPLSLQTYVRSLIEERLDTLIPISHQPRDLIHQIIMDTSTRFPEFSSSVRKRIRTYLKSYRRSKRVKDMQAAAAIAYNVNGSSSTVALPNGVTTAPKVMKVSYLFFTSFVCLIIWYFLLPLSLYPSLSPSLDNLIQ